MNFTISKSAFYNSLSLVSKAISSTSPLPALTGVKIDIFEDRLVLTGASSEFSIRHDLFVDHEINHLKIYETGQILMDARNLSEIVRKLDSNTLSMETVDGLMVRITGNLAIFTLNSMVVDGYPRIDFSKPE
ncbi:MAG TPA: DNA polymerase III subunit beta, partial [Erysipelothrix sp.]|nr:DNA polymerase III subunit beta [Erysipelothrix sp.]